MRKALLWAAALALVAQLAVAGGALFNDYWEHFCGPKDNCYDLLNVQQVKE